jgi:non-heme chloroperoxidase
MPTRTTKDGTEIYFKDWGTGQPIVFSHGSPLTGDAFEDQMMALASRGYRCIAHDRRGHGRSSQPWNGNDMDTCAADLAELTATLDLRDAVPVGHCTGGGEAARYVARHGRGRVARLVLIGAVPPIMLKTEANPGGLPIETFDAIREGVASDRSQFFKDLSLPFYGANRPGSKVSLALGDSFWLQGMTGGLKNEYDCIKAFFGNRLHRGPEVARRSHPDPARRRRPDRAIRRLRPAFRPTHQRCGAEGLPGRAARHVFDRKRQGQRRPAGIRQNMIARAARN